MYTHNLDPIFIDFGLIAIRWYSLAIFLEFYSVGGTEKNYWLYFKTQ